PMDEQQNHPETQRPAAPQPSESGAQSSAPGPVKRHRGRTVALIVAALVVVGVVLWLWHPWGGPGSGASAPGAASGARTGRFGRGGANAMANMAQPVHVAAATQGEMPVVLTALGTVTPLATVTVKTQINGQLVEVAFKEGQSVEKGDFLAQIDPRPYQVALAQAEGQLAKDTAALKNAEVDLARYRTLVAQNSLARQTLDTQAATVQQNRGVVQADQAQVDAQKLNLTYCRIVAPVGGRVGLRQVDPGNYVQTSDANGIVVITQLQPISVIFTLPEDSLQTVLKRLHDSAVLQTTAFDRTGASKLDAGRLETIDNQIDPTTGTVKLRAAFDNHDLLLFPNQFVNVQLLVETMQGATVIPVSAVQRGAPGTFVYVVKDDSTVAAIPVTLGPGQGAQVAVTKGLQPGQMIVTDGADRLKDGAKVTLAGGNRQNAAGGAPPAAEPAADKPAEPQQQRQRGQGQGAQGQGGQGQGQGRRRGSE
ncbi:MAG: MdtA/MuxA family multidrug efflux RND transporter periplasmic adaptor subunit, partial [Mycobacterium sp.]|uniref:MdtA/MuxA family multidrug efflux RND transporter periplasmic adaptor subunit n=1 Tax=Mycobacterium sp. TaxID=1785 RepID=UPI001EB8B833